jgi:nuclear transport factor 2 (NTF2) superfamily protein
MTLRDKLADAITSGQVKIEPTQVNNNSTRMLRDKLTEAMMTGKVTVKEAGPKKPDESFNAKGMVETSKSLVKGYFGKGSNKLNENNENVGLNALEEGPTRKHFQQVADLVKANPDEKKRHELAHHHAGLFAQQNPNFDRARFMAAAGVKDHGTTPAREQGAHKVEPFGARWGLKNKYAVTKEAADLEPTDEGLKKTRLAQYIKKAAANMSNKTFEMSTHRNDKDAARYVNTNQRAKDLQKYRNRKQGIDAATDRLTGVMKSKTTPGFKKKYTAESTQLQEHTGLSHEANELVLYGDNTHHLYTSSHMPIVKNLAKKIKKGTYDHEKAKQLWGYHADRAAKSYHKEFGSPGQKWHQMFTPEHRKEAAAHWADEQHAMIKNGEYSHALGESTTVADLLALTPFLVEAKKPTKDDMAWHHHRIAVDTVKNPMKGQFLGGPTAEEAEKTLRDQYKYTDKEIAKLKEGIDPERTALLMNELSQSTVKRYFPLADKDLKASKVHAAKDAKEGDKSGVEYETNRAKRRETGLKMARTRIREALFQKKNSEPLDEAAWKEWKVTHSDHPTLRDESGLYSKNHETTVKARDGLHAIKLVNKKFPHTKEYNRAYAQATDDAEYKDTQAAIARQKTESVEHLTEAHPDHARMRHYLSHAVTMHDKRRMNKPGYSHYAIAHYLGAVDDIMKDVDAGHDPHKAIDNHMNDRLAANCHKAIDKYHAVKASEANPTKPVTEAHDIKHETYQALETPRGYTGKVTPLSADYHTAGRMLRQRLPHYDKQQHIDAAKHHITMGGEHDRAWAGVLGHAKASLKGGDPGPLISGIHSDKFSSAHKDELRHHAHTATNHYSAAFAHYAAAGLKLDTAREHYHNLKPNTK